jgi:hypothetical protein
LLESGTRYPFSSFSSESCIKFFWGRMISIIISSSHCSTWYCITMFLIVYWWFQLPVFFPLV